MKNIKTKLLFTLTIGSMLFGCRPKPIDINIDPHKPKLVVAAQIFPGNIMLVGLTMSFSALSNSTHTDTVSGNFLSNILVKDAFVTVSYSNKTDTLFMLVPGIYASTSILQQDYGFYTLYARDPATGEEVTASSTLLPKVSFDTIYPVVIKTASDTSVSIKYGFTDRPNEDNWFVVNYYLKTNNESTFNLSNYFNQGSSKLLKDFDLLSDKTFEAGKYSAETLLYGIKATDTIAVSISNVSETYFQFLTARKRSGGFVNTLAGEPINYPTNVKNGYGYFNTHYPDYRIFDLNNY